MVTSVEARGPWSLNSGKPDIEELQAACPLEQNSDQESDIKRQLQQHQQDDRAKRPGS
jgi:hypothetical protein